MTFADLFEKLSENLFDVERVLLWRKEIDLSAVCRKMFLLKLLIEIVENQINESVLWTWINIVFSSFCLQWLKANKNGCFTGHSISMFVRGEKFIFLIVSDLFSLGQVKFRFISKKTFSPIDDALSTEIFHSQLLSFTMFRDGKSRSFVRLVRGNSSKISRIFAFSTKRLGKY